MNSSLKKMVRESGFKIGFLAKKIGVSGSMLSMCLSGDRNLSEDKEKALKDFLMKIPA